MGHFGRTPIRLAWFGIVLPALLLNYFGQGALVLRVARGGREPVLPPGAALASLYPLVVIATLATVVASQALISGAFSLTQQGVQLGYCPRVIDRSHVAVGGRADLHPGSEHGPDGRVPALVLGFQSSGALGGRVRHRRDRNDGDHDGAVLRHCAPALALVGAAGGRAGRRVPRDRRRVLRRQRHQDRGMAAGCRWRSAAACSSS